MRYLILFFILMLLLALVINCDNGNPSGPSTPTPIASYTESGEPVSPAVIAFQNTSQNADTYIWRFGDGDTTTLTSPSHTYATYGVYSVKLLAINTNTNRIDSCSKSLIITPGKAFIEGVRINTLPFTDSYGAGWDLFSGPDIYPDVVTTSSIILTFQSYYYLDTAPSNLPVQWILNTPYQITNWGTAYFIEIWDYDDFGDDYIGSTYGFRIEDVIITDGYVSSIERQNNTGTINATILIGWQ